MLPLARSLAIARCCAAPGAGSDLVRQYRAAAPLRRQEQHRRRARSAAAAVGGTRSTAPSLTPSLPPTPNQTKQRLHNGRKLAHELIREVAGLAPYEKRLIELLKVGKDKRALKVAKAKLGTHLRGKKKREEMAGVLRKMQSKK